MAKKAQYCKVFLERSFYSTTMKEAYMKAVKWYATTVLSKNESASGIGVQFIKGTTEDKSPFVTVKLFAIQDSEEIQKLNCSACAEAHRLFYMNDINCSKCEVKSYQNRVEESINIKSDYYRTKINEDDYI